MWVCVASAFSIRYVIKCIWHEFYAAQSHGYQSDLPVFPQQQRAQSHRTACQPLAPAAPTAAVSPTSHRKASVKTWARPPTCL